MHYLPPPNDFLDRVFEFLALKNVEVKHFDLDHICYRVESIEKYQLIKAKLTSDHQLLKESIINGREIAVFELSQAMKYRQRLIKVLELPAPKKGSLYQEGWEHVEFVIQDRLEKFIETYPLPFDLKGFSKPLNRDLRLRGNNFSIKFHEQSLKSIIKLESLR